jgi:hypothetical protein
VYDSRTAELTSLEEPVPEEVKKDIEPEFLGDRAPFEGKPDLLQQFSQGFIHKSTLNKRETYQHVLDLQLLAEDFRLNSVNERSFVCLDKTFFSHGFSMMEAPLNGSTR